MSESWQLGRKALPLLVIDEATRALDQKSLAGRTRLTKLVFLCEAEASTRAAVFCQPDPPYAFIPYNFGPFSRDLFDDLEDLYSRDLIGINTVALDTRGRVIQYVYALKTAGSEALAEHSANHRGSDELRTVIRRWAAFRSNDIVEEVHRRYPGMVAPE
jgi:uncharacterized protein YwgA